MVRNITQMKHWRNYTMSNFSKFKPHDDVQTLYGTKGKVLKTYKLDGEFMVHVQFESGPRSDYKESDLKFFHKDISGRKYEHVRDAGDKCPKCRTPWTKTAFGAKAWKDCVPCKKTSEELTGVSSVYMAETKEEPTEDDMDNWLDMLSAWDDSDDWLD